MQKILIIDDEPIIREGLKGVIPWHEYGYEICGVGVDGRDGLNKILSLQPDLVLLDIRMHGLSGIDVVKQVREVNSKIRFIILTAYSSFSYAKELMDYGIESYLLKPIDEVELIKILDKISEKRKQEKELASQLMLYNQLNEDRSLYALLEGELENVSEDIKEQLKDKHFQVARISFETEQVNLQWLNFEVVQTPDQIKKIRRDNYYHFLFIDMEESEITFFFKRIRERFSLYENDHIIFMLGSKVNKLEDIVESYHQVKELMDISFCFREKDTLVYNDLNFIDKKNTTLSDEIDNQRLFHYLEFNDTMNFKKELQVIREYYQSARYSKERIRVEIFKWSISMLQIIHKRYPSLSTISKDELEMNINKQESLQAIIAFLYKELSEIRSEFNGYSATKGNIVDQVKEYINYYYHEDITLKLVADLFHYNSAYLGKIFKRQTGDYFNIYLHKVRIEQAKKLLLNKEYKVYEISKHVGYSNSDYFYRNFKLYEGNSPKEYQMRHKV